VLRADVAVVKRLGFLRGQGEHLLHPRSVGNVADHLGLRSGADLLLDLHAHSFEVEAELGQNVDCDPLAEFDQAEQEMLRADVIVVETVGFLAGKGQNLLGAWSEIIHH